MSDNILKELSEEGIRASVRITADGFVAVCDIPGAEGISKTTSSIDEAYEWIKEVVVRHCPTSRFARRRFADAPAPAPDQPAPVPAEDPSRFAEQLESALGITPFKTACAAAEHLFSRHPLPYSAKYSLTKKNVEIFDAKERLVASVEDHDSLIHPRVIVDILNGIGYLTKPSKDDKLAKLGAALLDVLEQARMVSV